MKFAHISDIHLGQRQYHLPEREQDLYDTLKQAINRSIEEKVDFVIFSGDIFDGTRPPNEAVLLLMQQLMLLKENGIQSYFVLGDHDKPREKGNAIVWLYSMTGISHHLGDGDPIKFKDVLLIGLDHHDEGKDLEGLLEKFQKIDSLAKEHTGHKILVLHQALNEVHLHAGEINANDLPKNFTYYAIGDIHKNFEKKYDFLGGPLVYPGSIESASTEGIKEPPKGFYIVDISSEEAVPKWIELDLRPRYVIEADSNKFHAQIKDLISKIDPLRKPLVSLIISTEDYEKNRGIIQELDEQVLKLQIKPLESEEQYTLMMDESANIDEDFKRLAIKSVGPELAQVAFEQWYPLANEDKNEIKEIIINNFENFKARNEK